MNATTVYLKFYDFFDESYKWVPIEDILNVGNPIDEEGTDMELKDNTLYVWRDGERGHDYYSI